MSHSTSINGGVVVGAALKGHPRQIGGSRGLKMWSSLVFTDHYIGGTRNYKQFKLIAIDGDGFEGAYFAA